MKSFGWSLDLASLTSSQPLDPELERIVESITAQLQDGRRVDLEGLCADHPQHAASLRALLPLMTSLVGAAEATGDGTADGVNGSDCKSHPQRELGDFRILRELGRGGMGTVYEAEQLSMGRLVALKVLPFAALAQDKSLQRFHNEVRAAAALDHPHIVSVYSVGEERGIHYYAMQLIRGRSLADFIVEMRKSAGLECGNDRLPVDNYRLPVNNAPPAKAISAVVETSTLAETARSAAAPEYGRGTEYFRFVARLGIQTAEALQHAHDQGVLHRDIKPSNIMLDASGEPIITDFGLARIEADAGMTMTGDIIGTLRYMAPEQALAQRVVIDHRADVYSLGATLYELLALRPAFAETDRSVLLKQIAFEEPLPPRRLQQQIPIELEIIVLKAMANHREERFQSAQQLADDLRAFCEHRPIKARAASAAQRLRKWAWRHQSVVTAIAGALVLLLALSAASIAVLKRAESRTAAALDKTSALLYTADMTVAFDYFEKGWLDEVQTILDRQLPDAGKPDRRGFEWHLLQTLVRSPNSRTMAGHVGAVNELAVFANGRSLASVGDDGTLRIWSLSTRSLTKTIPICAKALSSVAVSPDNRLIAVGSDALYLCDIASGYRVSKLHQNEHTLESIVFTPDGQRLIVGTRYHQVLRIALDGEVEASIPTDARVESLEFLAGTDTLLVPNRRPVPGQEPNGIVQLWNSNLSKMSQEFDASRTELPGRISIARSSPKGRFVAAGARRSANVFLFESSTGRIVAETPVSRDWVTDVAYSPRETAIAVGHRNGRIEYFELQRDSNRMPQLSRRPVVIDAHRGEVTCTRFVDANSLVSSGTDGLIRIYNLRMDSSQTIELSDDDINSIQLSASGRRLFYSGRQEIGIVDPESGEAVFRNKRSDARFSSPAWSPAGDRAVVCDGTRNSVELFDDCGLPIWSISRALRVRHVAFSPDGLSIAVVDDEGLSICRAVDGAEVARLPLPGLPKTVAFSHAGTRILCGGGNIACVSFTADKLRLIATFTCPSETYCLTFSPDDSILAAGHGDSVIRLWDWESGYIRSELVGHERAILRLKFSSDGKTLISSAEDGAARIWSVEQATCYGTIFRRLHSDFRADPCEMSLAADRRLLAIGWRNSSPDAPDVILLNLDEQSDN
ncbi:MAG: serine/threonine-protein kinase [Pirellulales bacterium]